MSLRAGKFFLKKRGSRGIWQICWYDNATRQTASLSTGTSDDTAAEQALFRHALEHDKPKPKTDEQLAAVIQRYYTEYAERLPSAHHVRAALRDALEFWNDPDVSLLDRKEQLRFVASLRAKGLSDWTVQGRLTRLWAAMNWARRDNPQLIVPPMVTAADWKPVLEDRDQTYTLPQLAALLNACETEGRFGRDHWRRFLIVAIGTASREAAIRELTWAQVDLRLGRIKLNPEG